MGMARHALGAFLAAFCLVWCWNSADGVPLETTSCKLVLAGYGSKPGIHHASLHCDNTENPVAVGVNATHLGQFADSFTGVKVQKGCSEVAPVTSDFIVNPDDAVDVSEVAIYPLLCFKGDSEINFVDVLVENVVLDYDSAGTAWYTTALLAFGGSVTANLPAAMIRDNSAGSSLLLLDSAHVTLQQAAVTGNTAILGAAAAAWGEAVLHVKQQSTLSGNTAHTYGGAVYMVGASELFVSGSRFEENKAATGGALYTSHDVKAVANATTFRKNTAEEYGAAGEVAGSANFTVHGGVCEGNTAGTWGGCFDSMERAHLTLTQGFKCVGNKASLLGGCLSTSGSATLQVVGGSSILSNAAYSGGGVYSEGSTSVFVLNSMIEGNNASTIGGGLWGMDSSVISIKNSFVSKNVAGTQGGGAVITPSAAAFISQGSTFQNNTALKEGGALAALGADSKVVFDSSTVIKNSAAFGGAIWIADKAKVEIVGTKVEGNTATVDGGGIYANNGTTLKIAPSIASSGKSNAAVVTLNNAGRYGGGVLVNNKVCEIPRSTNDKIVNNSAKFDSDVSVPTTELTLLGPPKVHYLSRVGVVQGLLTQVKVSGLCNLGNGGMLVQAELEKEGNSSTAGGGSKQILGVALSEDEGLTTFNLDFRKPPGCYNITFSLVFNVDLTHYADDIKPVTLTVCVISCRPGEVTASSGDACEVCAAGTYSLNPANHTCDACPQGASCPGRALILPLPGHWHSSPRSHQVHRCPNPDACQGNLSATMQLVTANPCLNATLGLTPCEGTTLQAYTDQQCTSGYRGNLCGVCASGYSMSRQFTCGKCLMSKGAIVALVVLGAVAMLAVMRLQVHWTLSEQPSAHYDHDPLRRTDLCKALVLYMQYMLIVLFAINTSWPSSVVYVLQAPLAWLWSAYSSQTLSIQCLVPDSTGAVPQAMVQQLFYVVTPLVTVLLLLLIEATVFAFARKVPSAASVLRRFVGTALVVAFFCLPFTTRTIVNMFACLPVDHPTQAPYVVNAVGSYWTLDMGQMCYQGYHRAWALGLGLPLLVLVCVMLPAGVALLLVLNRGRLNERTFQNQFGFLFRSYRPSVCWWEAVVLCQTIMLVVITVFGHVLGPYLQGLVLFAALALIGIVLLVVRPYAHPEAGRVMLAGVGCLMLTSYASLLFLEPGYGQSVRPEVAQVIGVGLLMINVAYVTYVVIRLFMIVKWGKVYHNIRPGVHTSAAAAKQLAPKFSATSSLVLTGSSGLKFKSSGSVGLSPQPSNIPAGLHNTRSSSFSPVMGPSNQSLPVVNGLSNQSLSFVGSGRSSRQLLPVGSGGLSAPQPCVSASGLSQPLMSFQLQPPAMQPSPFASSTVNKP